VEVEVEMEEVLLPMFPRLHHHLRRHLMQSRS
jgi:hypothetical protein